EVTAVANGVGSQPVTVYVHQHVTKVIIQKVPGQPPTLSTACLSSAAPTLGPGPEGVLYEALAYGGPSGTTDLTPTVGQFSWSVAAITGQNGAVPVTLSSPGASAPLNQQIATAGIPGTTSLVANVG